MSDRARLLTVVAFLVAAAATFVPAPSGVAATTEADSATADSLLGPTIAAVGDMACDQSDPAFRTGEGGPLACAQRRTSDAMLADTTIDGGILGLGDYQYDCGDTADYAVSYDPTWGRLDPQWDALVAGNHEYKTGNDVFGSPCPTTNVTAQNFFTRFGFSNTYGPVSHPETAGHFSFDLGSWHLIGLNGNCANSGVGGCSASSKQTKWLKADLAATTQTCVLAFWHQPLWTGIQTGKNNKYKPWWAALYAAHADVVLGGHVHNYQRFAPMDFDGNPDSVNGITEYIAGTGGEKQVVVKAGVVPYPVAQVKSFGYLRMTLLETGWTEDFLDTFGNVIDSSTGTCHDVAVPPTSPPNNL